MKIHTPSCSWTKYQKEWRTLEIPYRKGTHITKEDTSDENITYSSPILSLFVLAYD